MASELLLESTREGVTTLTMNNPRRLNGWTVEMMTALYEALARLADADETEAVILTGADPYYCAGVNLSGVMRPEHPKKLRAFIIERNRGLFDTFINFPKPIIVAANGPAIGAAVTSATLCDAIVASDKATFSTPFARLGITPEGCSSVLFAKIMDARNAERMLGAQGWKPTAAEAFAAGFVTELVDHDKLQDAAHARARAAIEAGGGRSYRGDMTREELLAINARESEALADAFLGKPFLRAQFDFLWGKKKRGPAMMFLGLLVTRPLWSRML
ncbi:hypothetical protein PPSIR1_07118 [Plesiocystis pacifica SIR-1]|uniref:Enoyl-CoA hydratase n=1 Tax=Plesiocystis pacifica SIR-1 TaxID=391625 RepID=A6G582_9BACT|nr:enoyl-CoA hydratase/isomerase family protein [Plesiocystis pacifica]EDM78994.1 hypothetical protein PPSIR1_07118 [Plesiocystis pacifica SIR-1]